MAKLIFEKPEIALLEEKPEAPGAYRPAALPLWWPEDWLSAFWIEKFIPKGAPPKLTNAQIKELDVLFPKGWDLTFRPKPPPGGKKRRKSMPASNPATIPTAK